MDSNRKEKFISIKQGLEEISNDKRIIPKSKKPVRKEAEESEKITREEADL